MLTYRRDGEKEGILMEITIFAKKRKAHNGNEFYSYLAKLMNKNTGELETMDVKFKGEKPEPAACPMNIDVEKKDCNVSTRTYTDEASAETRIRKTLWVNAWTPGSAYEDHSMDDYF